MFSATGIVHHIFLLNRCCQSICVVWYDYRQVHCFTVMICCIGIVLRTRATDSCLFQLIHYLVESLPVLLLLEILNWCLNVQISSNKKLDLSTRSEFFKLYINIIGFFISEVKRYSYAGVKLSGKQYWYVWQFLAQGLSAIFVFCFFNCLM